MFRNTRAALLAVVIGMFLGPQQATAAVRNCGDFVASSGEDRQSDVVAKQRAMTGWVERARKLGPAFSAWRMATDKSLSCLKLTDGTHRCQAFARPCGISQVPETAPPGSNPMVPPAAKRKQWI